MNKREQDYAMERIGGLAKQKLTAIKEALPVIKPKRITYTKAVALIKQGKMTLRPNYPNREIYCNDDFEDIFDITEYHQEKRDYTPYDKAKYETKAEPIRKEVLRIQDQIMLGDATEALKLIEAFAKM